MTPEQIEVAWKVATNLAVTVMVVAFALAIVGAAWLAWDEWKNGPRD